MESYRITSDIERVETSVTIAGRRLPVRAAIILLLGLLLSIGLVGVLSAPLGSPMLFMPIGLLPLYVAALIAFVRPGDGRALELQFMDRLGYERRPHLAANLGSATLEVTRRVLDLRKEEVKVRDQRNGSDVTTQLTELDLPLVVRGRAGLELRIDDLVIRVEKEEEDEIAVTVREG